MAVDSFHKEYAGWLNIWTRIRDAVAGQDAVKQKGTTYLPMPAGMRADKVSGPQDYNDYKELATFLEASGRTLHGLVGTMFRKPVMGLDTIPDLLQPRLTNMDRRGTSLESLIKLSVRELLAMGRWGVLVDKPKQNTTDLPYVIPYDTEQIIDWQELQPEDSPPIVSQVRLQDYVFTVSPTDAFQTEQRRRILVAELSPEGVYQQRLFLEDESKKMSETGEVRTPTRRQAALTEIPFYFFNPTGDPGPAVFPSPLLGLVNENIAHYRTSADAEHIRHLTGCPTFVIADDGAKNSTDDIRLGGLSCIKLGTSGTWGTLGISGVEMGPQTESLKIHQENMAMLGSRLLEPQRVGVEASETHQLRQSGENATLVDIALACSKGWTQILQWMARWAGVAEAQVENIRIQLSTDFIPTRIDSTYLQALMQALIAGKISLNTFLWNLQVGEALPPGVSIEDEIALIEEDRTKELPSVRGEVEEAA